MSTVYYYCYYEIIRIGGEHSCYYGEQGTGQGQGKWSGGLGWVVGLGLRLGWGYLLLLVLVLVLVRPMRGGAGSKLYLRSAPNTRQ